MKRPLLILISLGLLFVPLGGCAPVQPIVDLSPLHNELGELSQTQRQQDVQIEQNHNRLLSLEAKVQEQQRQIGDLTRELATKKVTPSREITASSRPIFAPSTISPGVDTPSLSPTEIYLQAFSDYAAGRFEQAIQGFQTFMRLHASSDYAGNAQYWLGECYYSQEQYAQAVEAFQRTVESYPQGSKTPDALMKMASALNQLGQPGHAEEALQLLRSRYPDSPAARRPLGAN